ncbi:MAG: hypothetical protein J7J70_10885 [Deltaproteobacteria bacterium]|nr:hypothetical protein [Candidatus Tharpellaceae bacterium]
MMLKTKIGLVVMVVVFLLASSLSFSQIVIYGEVKDFNFHTGEVVLQTEMGESIFYLSQSTKAYLKSKKYPKGWEFLKDNLLNGTKVKIITLGESVAEIFVLEIPQ